MDNFYRNKSSAARSFFRNKAFVIIIGIAIVLVVTAGSIAFFQSAKGNTPEPNNLTVEIGDDSGVVAPVTDVPKLPIKEPEDKKPAEDIPKVENTIFYQLPLTADIIVGYSGATPVFSETLQDWRLHQGVDYATDSEAAVHAAADGIVEDVYDDGLMGVSVVIEHADGVRTIYQSLSDASVIKGAEVRCGDLVGYTGLSADAECESGIHLHFAAISDGVYIDPVSLFG